MNVVKPETLKQLRKSRGLTQEQLGVLSGMTKSQISKMENGLLGSDETVERLLSALGYSLEVNIRDNFSGDVPEKDRVLGVLRSFKKYNTERYGIESLALFGSVARNEQGEGSDVDVMIALKHPTLFLLAEVQDILKSVLKCDVDLITDRSAKAKQDFYAEIEKDLIYV